MSFRHYTGLQAGSAHTGQSPVPGYELWSDSDEGADAVLTAAWSNANVVETRVPGNYTVLGGVEIPTGFVGRVAWRLLESDEACIAEEWVSTLTRQGGVSPPREDCQ